MRETGEFYNQFKGSFIDQEYGNEFANGYKTGFFHSGGGRSAKPPLDRTHLPAFRQELFGFAMMIH